MKTFGFSSTLFKGKTVVITGAGRGIGLAVARAFKACGAKVIAHSGRVGTAVHLNHEVDHAFEADFMQSQSVHEFIDQVCATTDKIDILINNAGTMLGRFPADSVEQVDYDKLVMLNQTSLMMITKAFIPSLRLADESSIINTVSISATTGGSPGSSIYSSTKAFVATYSKALARELAPHNIRVNAVSPGTIMTDFHRRYSSKEKLEATSHSIPLKRLGTPEDCAPTYLFLANSQMASYITGQVVEINGGQLII
ncbi:MAG: SDR family oxidoreductase [Glaciecola sp.]